MNWKQHLCINCLDDFKQVFARLCSICGSQSDLWSMGRWMMVAKLCLICPGNEVNPELHEKIDKKKGLLYRDELPASVLEELALEVIQLKAQLRAQVAAAAPVT